jgi:L-malate glycosyltransferase
MTAPTVSNNCAESGTAKRCSASRAGRGFARPIRICFVIDRLTTGGTERQLLQLIDNLDRSRVEPFLCLLDGEDEDSRAMEPKSCEVVRLGVRVLRRFSAIGAAFRLAKTFRVWGIDVVQVHFPDSTYFGVLVAKVAGVPRIVRTRRDLFYWVTPTHRRTGRWINGFYNRFFVDAMITNSAACRQAALESERPAPKRVVVIENGIDLSRFDSVEFPPPMANAAVPPCVGAVAMLRREKRLDLLVEAAGILRDRGREVRFEIAGEGPMRGPLEARIRELGLAESFLLAGVARDVPAFLAQLDIAVLCSESEGLSNALIEYMVAGRAVVATAVGGNLELVQPETNGLLVPPADAVALADAVDRLLGDPALAARLGAAAAAMARARFSVRRAVRAHEDFYEQLVLGGLKAC